MSARIVATVQLSPSELMLGAVAGCMRQVENLKNGRQATYGAARSARGDFQMHIEGALGELVVAKHLGLTWCGKGIFRGPDVGADLQVRCSQGGRCLILHEDDADDATFYFVRWLPGSATFQVSEPLTGRQVKLLRYWREPPQVPHPAYFFPIDRAP